jgi:hypothetical protein
MVKLNVFNTSCYLYCRFGIQLTIITLVCISKAMISIGTCIGLVSVKCLYIRFVVFNATFNNISVISWRSAFLVEETGVPGENHRPVVSHCLTLSHNIVSSTPRHERGSNSQL